MRNLKSFLTGGSIGVLGGLIGLGGAEFRLPILVGGFRFSTRQAIVLNLSISLVTVSFSFIFRLLHIPLESVLGTWPPVVHLLTGSLLGSWTGAHIGSRLDRRKLDYAVMVLLVSLSILMMSEHYLHLEARPLFTEWYMMLPPGAVAGFGIGLVSSLLGVAGGELLIPALIFLYGVDIKLAGSLALLVSFPTIIVGLLKYHTTGALAVVRQEGAFAGWMAVGSIGGAFGGSLLLGLAPARALTFLLGFILLFSAIKIFSHRKSAPVD